MINTQNYMITRERLAIHELIGLSVRVLTQNVQGKIVNETKQMFTIETQTGEKMIPKHGNTFSFDLGNEHVEMDGNDIEQHPIERLKNGRTILYA